MANVNLRNLKKQALPALLAILLGMSSSCMTGASAADQGEGEYRQVDYAKSSQGKFGSRPCRILLMPNAQADLSEVKTSLSELLGPEGENGRIARVIGKGQMTTFVIELDPAKAADITKKIKKDSKHFGAVQQSLSYAAKTIVTGSTPFRDPLAKFQKHLQTTHVNQAVQQFGLNTGHSVVLGIVDTGLDRFNLDLRGSKVIKRIDCTHEDNNGMPLENPSDGDLNGHGTAMGTIAAALTNTFLGASPGYDLSLVSMRVQDTKGEILDEYIIDALLYAGLNKVKVINLSINGTPPYTISRAYLYSPVLWLWMNWYANGPDSCRGLIVNAAGNENKSDTALRSMEPYLIVVGATNYDDSKASFSNFGSRLDVSAPGVNVLSSLQDSNVALISGTSTATAQVSGILAKIWSQHPNMTSAQIRSRLLDHLRKPKGFPAGMGGGVVDMQAAF